MRGEELTKAIHHTSTTIIYLSLLWIPYIILLGYWLSLDETLFSQLVLILLIVPAFFQPLFWYFVLGGCLWIAIDTHRDKLDKLVGIVNQ